MQNERRANKEIYAQLYRNMAFVQKMLKQMEKIFKRMFEENVFRDDA